MNELLLEVKNLKVQFSVRKGIIRALDGVSFAIRRGETLGIIGESGSGKSVTARAIMQLLAKNGRIVDGEIIFHRPSETDPSQSIPVNITQLPPNSKQMRALRGGEIAMIFQEPMSSLTPVYTAGAHISEALELHYKPRQTIGTRMETNLRQTRGVSHREARTMGIELLRRVGIPRAEQQIDSYPHQLSGGQRQRVMIAVALSCNPSLLIADEPTTALDVTTQAQINDLIRDLQSEYNMAVMYITHDLGVIAEMAKSVSVMYLGQMVETGDIDSIFYDPKHPYTRALLESIPQLGKVRGARLAAIEGMVPDPFSIPKGCSFQDRCRSMMPGVCDVHSPKQIDINTRQSAACFLYETLMVDKSE
jgi:oligopeptide/dipeptide ABC transporter ATP-binding protein